MPRLPARFERTLHVTGAVDLNVEAGSGRIRVEPGPAGTVHVAARLRAGNAWFGGNDVEARPAGPWSVSAASGSVRMTLPPGAAFDLDARSASGSVSTTHPVTMTGSVERHRLAGQVRGGGPLVRVFTASGSIRIK